MMDTTSGKFDFNLTTAIPSGLILYGESIFSYVLMEIIPGIFATISLITFISGIIMNILFMVAIHRRGKLKQLAYEMLFHVAVLDCIALVLVVIPDMITGFAKKWVMGNAICIIEGLLVNCCFIMTFSYCIWSMFERVSCILFRTFHEKLFSLCHGKLFLIVISIQWICSLAYCILPLSGISAIEYQDEYGLQCDRTYSDSLVLTHVHFAIIFMLSFLVFIILSGMIVLKRLNQKELIIGDIENGSIISDTSQTNMLGPGKNSFEQLKGKQISHAKPNSKQANQKRKTVVVQKRKSNWDLYMDIDEFQLASTLSLTWLFVYGVWITYVVSAYLQVYQNPSFSVWKVTYPISVMLANMSYALKPITYVIHNKSIRHDIKGIIPGSAKKKYVEYNTKAKETMSNIEWKVKDKIHNIENKIHRVTHQKVESQHESPVCSSPRQKVSEKLRINSNHELGNVKRSESEATLDEYFDFEHGHDPKPKTSLSTSL